MGSTLNTLTKEAQHNSQHSLSDMEGGRWQKIATKVLAEENIYADGHQRNGPLVLTEMQIKVSKTLNIGGVNSYSGNKNHSFIGAMQLQYTVLSSELLSEVLSYCISIIFIVWFLSGSVLSHPFNKVHILRETSWNALWMRSNAFSKSIKHM